MKQLFFDDGNLFGRENVTRQYGVPQLEAIYEDGLFSTDVATGYVFHADDGCYRLIYHGKNKNSHEMACLMAVSNDGIHFVPEDVRGKVTLENRLADNELLKLPDEEPEIACIFEDKQAPAAERYKMLVCERCLAKMVQKHKLYVSADLYNWNVKDSVHWGKGDAEPIADVFYNHVRGCYTILQRPDWGVRRVGFTETTDWEHYTEYTPCIQADAMDEPLAELYGMRAIAYEGMFVGFPYIYAGHHSEYNGKFLGGTVESQLAYSYDGRYWLRSLREPFLGTKAAMKSTNTLYPLMWLSCVREREDGTILIYASASKLVHGEAFGKPGTGQIHVYSLRSDGFVSLKTEDTTKPSTVCTRELLWRDGELHINICAQNATIAVRSTFEKTKDDTNFMGFSEPVPGFGHEDCIPFSGDTVNWIPQFKNGKRLCDLQGKTLVFEIKFYDGQVYSFEGDYTPFGNIQASRYRKLSALPEISW